MLCETSFSCQTGTILISNSRNDTVLGKVHFTSNSFLVLGPTSGLSSLCKANVGRNQNFRKFRSKTEWIGSLQLEKFRNSLVHLSRWTFSRFDRSDRKLTVPFYGLNF